MPPRRSACSEGAADVRRREQGGGMLRVVAGRWPCLVGPVPVVEVLELAGMEQVCFAAGSESSEQLAAAGQHPSLHDRISCLASAEHDLVASLSTTSNRAGNLPSRSGCRNRARRPPASSRSMTRFRTAWTTRRYSGRAQDPDLAGGVLDELPLHEQAGAAAEESRRNRSGASAWERRKLAHVVEASCAGPIPACRRISIPRRRRP